ncbi:MAG TPA: AsmA family protein [Bauldia sp.]|nr:AsmA family protein [Bauldia sp.]
MLILGGLLVIALFAALVGPWFINWDDYKANFEAEAEKILGQPVRVDGSAKASILPSPSLTFTDVKVGDTEGRPMMTVEKFSVTIELMPLLEGEIRVVTMKIEKPVVTVSTDDSGNIDWLLRTEASKALDPDKVVLDDVEISDGTLTYRDARSGVDLTFAGINATVGARSLSGPWRVEGT